MQSFKGCLRKLAWYVEAAGRIAYLLNSHVRCDKAFIEVVDGSCNDNRFWKGPWENDGQQHERLDSA